MPVLALPESSALDAVLIVLCRPSHPGNIGAVARAMKNMGLTRLALVNPKLFPDPEAEARAAGATDVLAAARVCASLDEALAETVLAVALSARSRDLGPQTQTVRAAAAGLLTQAGQGQVALVFGNETSGLSNEELQRCQRSVTIPANPEFSSLNLGAAVQVMAYELRMAWLAAEAGQCSENPTEVGVLAENHPLLDAQVRRHGGVGPAAPATPFASPPAAHADVERLMAHLEQVMVRTAFHDPANPRRLLPKLRRLFARTGLERDEVNILRGILDAVEKNLR